MKRILTCGAINLLGIGAGVWAMSLSQSETSLFWVVLMYALAACFLIAPYLPIVVMGICITALIIGLCLAFFCWIFRNDYSIDGSFISLLLCISGASGVCLILSPIIGAILELTEK